jgi:hypothetical protein
MTRRNSPTEPVGDAWFEYDRTDGRFSAMPIHWKGWLALVLLVAVPNAALLLALRQAGGELSAFARLAIIVATIAAISYAAVKLAIAKGRQKA